MALQTRTPKPGASAKLKDGVRNPCSRKSIPCSRSNRAQKFPARPLREFLRKATTSQPVGTAIFGRIASESKKFPVLSLLSREFLTCRPVSQDCVRHQEVHASWHDFLGHRIARHSRGLRRQQSVCGVHSAVLRGNSRRVRSKVSGRKIPFPELLLATCPPRSISNGP